MDHKNIIFLWLPKFSFIPRSDGQEYLSSLVFALSTDTSLGRTEEDLALVAVTDGHTVKLTPMREAVIPPPMSAYEIHVESQELRQK